VVGDTGTIITSADGVTWTARTSGTSNNLNGITYDDIGQKFVIVGDDNTILSSTNGTTWTTSSVYTVDPTVYTVQGDAFTAGYGPEELVPGVVSDNLTMIVNTRPGSNWPVGRYGHVGFNVVSTQITPSELTQVEYSFLHVVQDPATLAVYDLDLTTGSSVRTFAFTVDWVNKIITLDSQLAANHALVIELYEVGNGDQLEKSNSQVVPFIDNTVTGFTEIPLNCNYSANRFNGSGVIRPGSLPKQVLCTETRTLDDSILCDDVTDFVLNQAISFQGDVLGGLQLDTYYYVKTISYASSRITVSSTVVDGLAGPTFVLSDDSGLMSAIISAVIDVAWTDPIVIHNGNALLFGHQTIATQTKSASDSIVVTTTSGFYPGDLITFSDEIDSFIYDTGLIAQTQYAILTIIDDNEFTVEDPSNPGNALALNDSTGIATCIVGDYAFAQDNNNITAKMVFATQYNQTDDFVQFTVFGETEPTQYGYSLPLTEVFTATGGETEFSLTNYTGGDNPTNAIVEKNGLRLNYTTDYTISATTDTITLVSSLTAGDELAVTTYNTTDRQYLNTAYNSTYAGAIVSNITDINNTITAPVQTTLCNQVNTGTNTIDCGSTSGVVSGLEVTFKGTSFGGLLTDGTVYLVDTVPTGTSFTIKTQAGTPITFSSTVTGSVIAYIGGTPAVTVITGIAHGLTTNDIVRIDGTTGSLQLNNNTYYARVINTTTFELYLAAYSSVLNYANSPVTKVSSYTGGGYAWEDQTFTLYNTTGSDTSSTGNKITVSDTTYLEVNTPVYFSGDLTGTNLVEGTEYFIKAITSSTEFTVSATYEGDEFVLGTATVAFNVSMWEQSNVDRVWVSVNGYRIPSSQLYLNPNNNLSILHTISPSDTVIITTMIPTATPNENTYILNVNKDSIPSVYRANTLTTTWLTQPLQYTDSVIYVEDVSKLTATLVQTDTVPALVDGVATIGLEADKRTIAQVIVKNGSTTLPSSSYSVGIVDTAPVLNITSGVTAGDTVTITLILGNILYVAGEQIRFTTVDFDANTITGLQRGANGTGERDFIPAYAKVYSALSQDKLPDSYYNQTWNSYVYNTVLGDPLQISNTFSANFLKADYA
jgi:hypothetical protein